MDYTASDLPRSIGCSTKNQGVLVFNGLNAPPAVFELSSLDGVATVSPRAFAYFDESGNPVFGNPVIIERSLFGLSFEPVPRPLATILFAIDVIPSFLEPDDCFPPAHPDCGVP